MLLKIRNFTKSNLFKYISSNFISVILGFFISSYILIKLGPKELGIFTLFMILVGLFSSIAQGAANSYLMKNFFNQNRNQTITSVNITMLIFSLLSFFLYSLLLIIGFDSYFYVDYFMMFAVLKALNSTPFVVMRLYEDANSFLIWSIASKSLYVLAVLLLIYLNLFNVENLIMILYLNEIVFFFFLYWQLYYKYHFVFSVYFPYIKNNIKLSIKLFPHKVFKTIYENVDKYAIQFFIGSEALGIYSMVLRLVSPISIFIKAVNNEFAVIMSKVYANKAQFEQLVSTEKKILILLFGVNIATIVLAVLYNDFIYRLGDEFYTLLMLALILNNSMFFYYIFYNTLFLNGQKAIYYIMGINLLIFGIFSVFFHTDSISILLILVSINLIDNILFSVINKS